MIKTFTSEAFQGIYIHQVTSSEIQADIFMGLERVRYRKTSKNSSQCFKRRYLTIHLLSNSKFHPWGKILEFKI